MNTSLIISIFFILYVSMVSLILMLWWMLANRLQTATHRAREFAEAVLPVEPAMHAFNNSQSLKEKECLFAYEQWHTISCLRNLQRAFAALRDSGKSTTITKMMLDEATPLIRSFNLNLTSLQDKYDPQHNRNKNN